MNMEEFTDLLSAEDHLESVLEEYNQKIDTLENGGATEIEELLEAYVNRGSVLAVMEHYIASVSDFEEASNLMDDLELLGRKADAGTYVKTYVSIGRMSDEEGMAEAYDKASSRLKELRPTSRHYDMEHMIDMCLSCASDLADADMGDKAMPYIKKVVQTLSSSDDSWGMNRMVEAYNLLGQIKQLDDRDESITAFEAAAEISERLYADKELDDPLEMALSYVSLGDIYEELEMHKQSIRYHERAAEVLEEMYSEGKLGDTELLISLHQGLSTNLFMIGSDKDAELHLLRAAEIASRSP